MLTILMSNWTEIGSRCNIFQIEVIRESVSIFVEM